VELFEDTASLLRERGVGPHHSMWVLNTQLYVLITGCRWCDRKVNNGHQKFCYRWLKRWYEDGTEKLKGRILAVAEEKE